MLQTPLGAVAGPRYKLADTLDKDSDPLASPAVPSPRAAAPAAVREMPVSQELDVTLAVLDQQSTLRLGTSVYPAPLPEVTLAKEKIPDVKSPI